LTASSPFLVKNKGFIFGGGEDLSERRGDGWISPLDPI
jgi:hypothetical protein